MRPAWGGEMGWAVVFISEERRRLCYREGSYLRQAQTQAMAKRAGDGGIGILKVVGWVGLQLV